MAKIKLLFLTHPEHGEANSQFAVISAIQQHYGDNVDIHLGSYDNLRYRVPPGVTFHVIEGTPIGEWGKVDKADANKEFSLFEATRDAITFPGFWGAARSYSKMMPTFYGTNSDKAASRYLATVFSAQKLIEEVKPDFCVVNALFEQARDAAYMSGVKWVLLSPLGLRDNSFSDQGAGIFNWPAIASGYSYPVTGIKFILNLILQLYLPFCIFVVDTVSRKVLRSRHAAGIDGGMPLLAPRRVPVVCMGTPEADYPGIVPSDVICCGPIVQASKPVEQVDPELSKWLAGRPTVLIVLGSHWALTQEEATNVWTACKALLEARPDLQVLWKLKKFEEITYDLSDELGDRMRIVDWLNADPLAILKTGQVVCFVNHGGSNSYHEGLMTGVPQVLMSIWYDTHDLAAKAEFLKVGIWGNKKNSPSNSVPEFTDALFKVIGKTKDDPSAARYAARAKELADIVCHRKNGGPGKEGRDVAAEYIWDQAQRAIAMRD